MIRFLLMMAIFSATQATTEDLVSRENHFRLKYPARWEVRTFASTDYEKDFNFDSGGVQRLHLGVVDLGKYLPMTDTRDIKSFVATFKQMKKYRESQIGGKPAYEYLTCGRGACSQEVVFIHAGRMYNFSINALDARPTLFPLRADPLKSERL